MALCSFSNGERKTQTSKSKAAQMVYGLPIRSVNALETSELANDGT